MQDDSSEGGISHVRHLRYALACVMSLFPSGDSRFQSTVGEGDCLPIASNDLVAAILAFEDRPVTAPCGHNFCMKCFGKWTIGQGKRTCAECRKVIPLRMVRNPWINSALVSAIRLAKGWSSQRQEHQQMQHLPRESTSQQQQKHPPLKLLLMANLWKLKLMEKNSNHSDR
ncbi:unnamed protein product [Microthlaspi erraticum]|uniref:RING-type E3 ubiquitin transferase n=1 Tax=Microthlaspi erraticum TaxID=1685480 RepID=A0A6D2KNI6_9BRAS|nr:unnamed protein product [Microthlaspi erraticum]